MKRSDYLNLAALACLAAAGLIVTPAAAAPTGPGSIDGVWFGSKFSAEREGPPGELPRERPTQDGSAPKLQPWAEKVVAARIQQYKDGHPFAKLNSVCVPDGVPSMMFPAPERPIQIVEAGGQVTILFEHDNIYRVIHLGGTHPKNPTPSLMGHSIGHWDGDALVVDTIGLNDKSSIDGLIPHTDALHVVERFRRSSDGTLDYRATIDDPKTVIQPYTVVFPYKRVPGEVIGESVCVNQRNAIDANGNTTIQLSTDKQPSVRANIEFHEEK